MASVVDICNSALNQIGASNIIALTEDSKAAMASFLGRSEVPWRNR